MLMVAIVQFSKIRVWKFSQWKRKKYCVVKCWATLVVAISCLMQRSIVEICIVSSTSRRRVTVSWWIVKICVINVIITAMKFPYRMKSCCWDFVCEESSRAADDVGLRSLCEWCNSRHERDTERDGRVYARSVQATTHSKVLSRFR